MLFCRNVEIKAYEVGIEKIKKVQNWAVATLRLKKHPSYKTIMRVLRDEKNIVQWNNSEGYGKKNVWCVTNRVLEEELRL